jgi:hypothetical protein
MGELAIVMATKQRLRAPNGKRIITKFKSTEVGQGKFLHFAAVKL